MCVCVCIWRQTPYWKCGFSCNLKMWKASSLSPKCERSSVQRAPFNVRTWRLETNGCSARIVGLKTERQKKKSCAGFQTASITAHINRTRNTNMIKFSVIPVITVKRYYISTLRKFTSTHPDPNSSFHQYEKYTNKKYKYSRTLSR